jgi:hypothetical protein
MKKVQTAPQPPRQRIITSVADLPVPIPNFNHRGEANRDTTYLFKRENGSIGQSIVAATKPPRSRLAYAAISAMLSQAYSGARDKPGFYRSAGLTEQDLIAADNGDNVIMPSEGYAAIRAKHECGDRKMNIDYSNTNGWRELVVRCP